MRPPDLRGLPDWEIAGQPALTLPSLKMRLHRARLRLKGPLARACEFSHNERGVFVCTRKPPGP